MVWLRIAGLRPKRRFHRLQLRMAVPVAEGASSPAVKSRASAGWTPRVVNKFQETSAPLKFSAICPPEGEREYPLSCTRARLLKLVLSFFHSAKTPPETILCESVIGSLS